MLLISTYSLFVSVFVRRLFGGAMLPVTPFFSGPLSWQSWHCATVVHTNPDWMSMEVPPGLPILKAPRALWVRWLSTVGSAQPVSARQSLGPSEILQQRPHGDVVDLGTCVHRSFSSLNTCASLHVGNAAGSLVHKWRQA